MPKRGSFSQSNENRDVTQAAASKLRSLFQALVARGKTRALAQRFTLQCATLFFLEDRDFLPDKPFRRFLMQSRLVFEPQEILTQPVDFLNPWKPIDLELPELLLIGEFGEFDWSRIHPRILGALFQATMRTPERHERGAHYTPEAAILEYVIRPLLVEPWRARIHEVLTLPELLAVHESLTKMRILDPACGSGNFLYEALRALQGLEKEIVERARSDFQFSLPARKGVGSGQLLGIDIDPLAVELTRLTLFLGQHEKHFETDIRHADALFCAWPKADLILGNPPFQSKNRMQQEFGPDYVLRLREKYPDVSGRADYCVYWFRRAHDELAPGASAGLVGTNTIRQNDSRTGGLDYIVKHGGTIIEAVSTMVWPGEAIVHVSVVNWTKGIVTGPKKLSWQIGDQIDSSWKQIFLDNIPASLSAEIDVTAAKSLRANALSSSCYQGQTHGHEGFLLSPPEARFLLEASPQNHEVIFPYLVGDDLLSNLHGKPSRWVIDFGTRERTDASHYEVPFRRIEKRVLPDRKAAARHENVRNQKIATKGNQHHAQFLKHWWQLSYPRRELMGQLQNLKRYIVCSRVTKRPVFEFVDARIHPSDALAVFALEDDYSFGILQSALHWAWFTARCSTLTARYRYTSESVFNSFPWPQSPTKKQCSVVAKSAVALRTLRHQIATEHGMNLRAMYATAERASEHALKDAHVTLDEAVRAAYRMAAHEDALAFLLELNQDCAEREKRGEKIIGPGLPEGLSAEEFVTKDKIEPPTLF